MKKSKKKTTVNLGKKGKFGIHKGALHRALGVPEGEKIPAGKMAKAKVSKNPHVRRMAASAKGLKAMHKGKRHRKTDRIGHALSS